MNTVTVSDEPDSGYSRLEQQINWYDSKSGSAQKFYKRIKFVEFSLGAAIPFMAHVSPWATSTIGVAVILLEGLQHLNQWQHNWITYRSTCEALRHEKYSYLGRSGVYDSHSDEECKKILVERVESLVSTEHAKWISRQEYDSKKAKVKKV
jgi:Protein of unknown function (DUF4231)